MRPTSSARAIVSASMRSFLRLCWPIPSCRTRVVSSISGSCPHASIWSWTAHASRHASNATFAGGVLGPSRRTNPDKLVSTARSTTCPSFTSQ